MHTLHVPVQKPRSPFLEEMLGRGRQQCLGLADKIDLSACRLFKHTQLIFTLNLILSVQACP